ncbi:MAG: hypothetical protein K9G57_02330 [Ignavibacteriales bacterium]|nr:hypothetical protein [Ignavibacteriales bacterium]
MIVKKIYYLLPGLLAVIIFFSDFLSTDLFDAGLANFSVWFILSLFAFVCGWLINKTFGWIWGGRIVFAVTIASAVVTVFLVSYFNGYFGVDDLLSENLVLFLLRNVFLGAIGLFGMSVSEVLALQEQNKLLTQISEGKDDITNELNKKIQVLNKEVNLNTSKLVSDIKEEFSLIQDNLNKLTDILESKK